MGRDDRAFRPRTLLCSESYAPQEHLPPLLYDKRHERSVWSAVAREVGEVTWGSGVYSRSNQPKMVAVPGYQGWVVGADFDAFVFLDEVPQLLRVLSLHAPTGRGA